VRNLLRQWVASGPRMAVLRIGNEEWTLPVCRGDTADVVARFLAKAMNERGADERERVLAGVLTVNVEARCDDSP